MYSYFVLQGCISQLSEYFRRNVFILGLIAILLSAFQVSKKLKTSWKSFQINAWQYGCGKIIIASEGRTPDRVFYRTVFCFRRTTLAVPRVSFRECFLDWELTSNLCFALKFATVLPCKAIDSRKSFEGIWLKVLFFTYSTKIDIWESFIFFTYICSLKKFTPQFYWRRLSPLPIRKW